MWFTELDRRVPELRRAKSALVAATITSINHNAGNFICDVMVAATNADFALLNSGTLRSDSVHHAGPFFLKAEYSFSLADSNSECQIVKLTL